MTEENTNAESPIPKDESKFNLPEKFIQKKADMTLLADKYKDLKINGIDDKEGYKKVNEARKELKTARRDVERFGEAYKKVLLVRHGEEKDEVKKKIAEYVEIVKGEEDRLDHIQKEMDKEISIAERRVLLPDRKKKLASIDYLTIGDDELLEMTPEQFTAFYNEKNGEYLEEKARVLREAEEKVAMDRKIEDAKKESRLKAEQDAKDLAGKVKQEAEDREAKIKEDAKKAKKEAEKKAEEEKQKIKDDAEEARRKLIDDQKKRDDDREQAEKDEIAEEAQAKKEEGDAKAAIESNERYVKFLADLGCTPETKSNFIVTDEGGLKVLWEKKGTYNPE